MTNKVKELVHAIIVNKGIYVYRVSMKKTSKEYILLLFVNIMISQDFHSLVSSLVFHYVLPIVQTNPSIFIKSLIAKVQSRYDYTITY